jgi:hypothetical protein
MRIHHGLLLLGFSGQALELSAQVPASPPEATDTLVAGCRGGETGGGRGLLVTRRGEIFEWQKDGPDALGSGDYKMLGNDSVTAAAVFLELARIGFRSIEQLKPSNMTCFLSFIGPDGRHSVSFPLGEPPVQLDRARHLLETLRHAGEPVLQRMVPPVAPAAQPSLECGRGRMRSQDVAACAERFNRLFGRVLLTLGAVILPIVAILLRRTAIFQLAEAYPPVQPRTQCRRVFASAMFVGALFYRCSAWLTIDDSYLHISGFGPARLWVPRLSIALSDITATPEKFRWGLYNRLTIRLRLARDPRVRFLVWPDDFEKLAAAGGGRLRLAEPTPVAAQSIAQSY